MGWSAPKEHRTPETIYDSLDIRGKKRSTLFSLANGIGSQASHRHQSAIEFRYSYEKEECFNMNTTHNSTGLKIAKMR